MARTRLLVDIEANSAKLVSEVEKSRKSIQGMQHDLKLIKFDSIVNLGERAFRAGQQIYNLAKSMSSFGSEIQRNARNLDMTISQYQQWLYVAKAADVETQQFLMGVRVLTKNMGDAAQGTGEAKEAFKALGVSVLKSDGNLKSMQEFLPEIIDRLSKVKNVTQQNAMAIDIFGARSGMAMVNLVREGKNIDQIIKHFKDLGLEIGEGTIKKLAESEQAFKDLGFQMLKFKAEVLAPVIGSFGNLVLVLKDTIQLAKDAVEWITKIGSMAPSAPSPEAWGGTAATQFYAPWLGQKPSGVSFEEATGYKQRSRGEFAGGPMTVAAGGMGGIGGGAAMDTKAVIKSYDYMWSAYADQAKKYTEMVNQVVADHMENIKGDFIDFQTAAVQGWEYIGTEGEISLEKLESLAQEVADSWTKVMGAVYGGEGNMYDYGALIPLKQYEDGLKKTSATTMDFGKMTEDVFGKLGSSLTTLVDSSASFKERMTAIFSDLANNLISSLTKAMIQMAIFGNMQGDLSGGKGWGSSGQSGYGGLIGIIGSVVGSLQTGTDYVPHTGLYQLHQGESVIPAGENQGGSQTVIVINAVDAKSFDDVVRRNPESILSVSHRSSRTGGSFRRILRGS